MKGRQMEATSTETGLGLITRPSSRGVGSALGFQHSSS
jgi:hypothetical protein